MICRKKGERKIKEKGADILLGWTVGISHTLKGEGADILSGWAVGISHTLIVCNHSLSNESCRFSFPHQPAPRRTGACMVHPDDMHCGRPVHLAPAAQVPELRQRLVGKPHGPARASRDSRPRMGRRFPRDCRKGCRRDWQKRCFWWKCRRRRALEGGSARTESFNGWRQPEERATRCKRWRRQWRALESADVGGHAS